MTVSTPVSGLSREEKALLFERLRERKKAEAPQARIPRRTPGLDAVPLSFAQERFWFLDRLQPGSSLYNMLHALAAHGDLSPALLEAALNGVVERHESLRTSFAESDGRPRQVISPPRRSHLPLVDLASLPETSREGEVRRLAGAEARRAFDLERGPLLRATLIRRGGSEHVLLLDMHHIVSDGWSMGVLVREITLLYAAALRGEPSPLPELPIQYADFAVWQREWLREATLEKQLAYWRERLAGAPAALDLPTDRQRPAVQSFHGGITTFWVGPEITAGLNALSRRHESSLFMTLLAVFQALLCRLGGQHDLPVGSPIANRGRTEIAPLIGLFVNTLVLRADLSGDPAFERLLGQVRSLALEAYAHQDLPFERLVEELRPERHLSHNPLFQVVFTLQTAPPGGRLDLSGLVLEPVDLETLTAKFDLELVVNEIQDVLGAGLLFSTDLFDPTTVQRFAGHFQVLLSAVVEDPGRRLSELPLLAAAERHQLLEEWNDTRTAEGEAGVLELFDAQAARRPDAPAVACEGDRLTYGELARRAGVLAGRLRASGVGPGTVVGLCLERSVDIAVGILGIWKAGGAYVPLDPALPEARLSYLLEDSAVPVLVTREKVLQRLPAHGAEVVLVDASGPAAAPGGLSAPGAPGDLAYLIYTSGTTGKPKAVMVEHRGLVSTLQAVRRAFGFGPGDRMPCVAPFSFDIFLFELLGPLLSGGAAVLLPLRPTLDVEHLVDHGLGEATLLHAVPALMRQVVDAVRQRALTTRLRALFVGGDVVPADLLADLRETFPAARAHVLYGPTEATIVCTSWTVPAAGPVRSLLGWPLDNAVVRLCDRDGHLVPIGVAGEIWIGGPGVARGYWRREELTAEKFVDVGGERFFRSGDLARRLPGGELEFLGRIDQQVKVRGFRVELGEIESALARHPAVREAVVVVRDDPAAGRRLVAYVVLDPGEGGGEAAALRRFLQAELPDYMVPGAFVPLDSLPVNAHGKVDRAALPVPEAGGGGEPVLPRTPLEEALAEVWADLLGRERVGVEDNFFELGGHSLLATQLVSRLRQRLELEVPVRVLFEEPTIGGLAAWIESEHPAAGSGAAIVPVSRDEAMPLSFSQERLWFLDRLMPGTSVYNMPSPLRLRGPLDPGLLERCFGEVVRRHESLRTHFAEQDGTPVQVVAPARPWTLPRVDLSALPETGRQGEARRWLAEETGWPFDLTRGPLLRTVLLRMGEGEHLLLLTIHHIVSDGWSTGLLIRELIALYGAFAAGEPSPLPELPLQYPDFARWQRQRLSGPALESQLAYWREHLAGSPPSLDLPLDHPRPVVQTFRGDAVIVELPRELTANLKALGQTERASLFMTLLAGFKLLLARLSGQQDVVVGSPVAGRERKELEGLIGFFLNSLALRTDLSGGPSFRELLRRVRKTALGAYSHQEIPFEMLLAELQLERDLSRTPLFQVFFNMLNFPREPVDLPGGLTVEPLSAQQVESKFDLTIYALEGPRQELLLNFVYNADLFDRRRIEEMGRQYSALLSQVALSPETPVDRFSLLTPEAAALLPDPTALLGDEWRGAVHELFVEQARRQPGKPALVDAEGTWTYGDLDAASGRLAARLAESGVGRGDRVAIYAHRSAPVVWAVLGTLRAGAAFVLLDPAYPAARLVEMARLAAPRAWLEIAAAGPVPPELEAFLSELAPACRLSLPAGGFDGARALLAGLPPEGLTAAVGPDDVALLAFTSGSTGIPKGIQGRHGPLSHFLPWQCARFGLGELDRYSMVSGLAHDPLQRDMFTPLTTGATLCIPSPEEIGAPGRLAAWMARQEITVAHLTPAMGQLLTEPAGHGARVEIPSLRYTLLVGDVLTRLDVDRIRSLAPRVTVVNLYGSTETQRAVGYHVVEDGGGTERAQQILPLGRGMQDVQLLVVALPQPGESPSLAGVGEVGEIWVRSPHLAKGYLGDEALTAERFQVNPFTGRPGDRIYRTGDLGRYLPDGQATFAGRADQQVKIRGFRIELGEIEAVLGRLPGVREAVVIARQDGPDTASRRLVAYVVADPEAPFAELEALRDALREKLPAYMVPSAFVRLDKLPVTPNGKVDRKALPAPEALETAGGDAGFAEPVGDLERAMAGIWKEVLGLERVGARQSFFDLGGHSLLATRVIARIRQVLGVDLPLRAFFEHPTLAGLALAVERERSTAQGVSIPPLVPRQDEAPAPLSYAQQRLWFLDRLMPGNPVYNLAGGVRLSGPLDLAALGAGLQETVRRHETLRTGFEEIDGRPVQRIVPALGVRLPVVDLTALPSGRREEAVRAALTRSGRQPFELTRPGLLTTTLLRLDEREHVLLYCMHHIVSDAWSMGILVREVAALYAAFSRRLPSPLPELPVQYADFAVWQRQWLTGEVLDRQVRYWRERLTGAPGTELPSDRPRPALQSFRGARLRDSYPGELADSLGTLGRRRDASLFMVLLAAFQTLLGRYSGEDDIVVGFPIANRAHSGLESLIGFFVNTLVLRTDLAGDPRFLDLLERVKEASLGAHAHQDVPFEQLVEELQPRRDLSRNPLFQVMFNLLNVPASRLEASDLTMSPLPPPGEASVFDLQAYVTDTGAGLAISWEYGTDLFEPSTIERFSAHFRTLLEEIAASPERRLSELPVLPAAEREQLLAGWNDTALHYPDVCAHQLIEEQARRSPLAVALRVEGGESLTYAELNGRANGLARRLRGMGVGPGALAAVAMERSAEMVVALLAVWKAGGAYVPLDPTHPAERLAHVLEDSGASVLLTRPGTGLPGRAGLTVVQVEPGEGAGDLEPLAGPEDLAYVIYTSGSTGRPKGVEVRHGGLVSFLTSMAREPGLGRTDVLLAVTTISFDIAGLELYLPLTVGGQVVLASRETAMDGTRLAAALSGVTVLQATPATWRLLLESGWEGSPGLKALCGGEALPRDLAREISARVGSLWNVYGPTETTIWSTLRRVDGEAPESAGAGISVGRPIANTSVHLLGRHLELVPVGAVGEIHIGGAGLARGYLGRPELTAERFVPDPFAPSGGSRLYRTGDLGRRLAGGEIEFWGRVDDQVKVRGYRVEPGEIEAALVEHSAVRQAVVVARQDEPGDARLVAYLVREPGAPVPLSELRDALASRLPAYMVPAVLMELDALPLTPSGKVDRKALPRPEMPAEGERSAPRTATEIALADIWAEVLGVEAVGLEDGFFDLGGHSLLATRVIARIRQVLEVDLPLRAFFEQPTLAGLARAVERERNAAQGLSIPPLARRRDAGPAPLSYAQQRLWVMDRLVPGSPFYNLTTAVRITGDLDVAVFRRTVEEIVRRHEALRTSFMEGEQGPRQLVHPAGSVAVPLVDLGALGAEEREREARRLGSNEALVPFDLGAGLLIRCRLLRLGDGDHVVFCTMHHIASDYLSLGVFVGEVGALYNAFFRGEASPLPELPVQYADFAAWQRQWLTGEVLDAEVAYWMRQLAGAPPRIVLRAGRPDSREPDFRGATRTFELPAALVADLRGVSRAHGSTLFMTLLAGFEVLLHHLSGQDDFVVGTPIGYRNWPEIEGSIGLFANILALRGELGGNPTFRELLARARRTVLGAFTHQHVPFERLVEELRLERSLDGNPLFQVTFNLVEGPAGAPASPAAPDAGDAGDAAIRPFEIDRGTAQFDLALVLTGGTGGLTGSLQYKTALFDAATADWLPAQLRRLLERVAADPSVPLEELRRMLVQADEERRAAVDQELEDASFRKFRERRRRSVPAPPETSGEA